MSAPMTQAGGIDSMNGVSLAEVRDIVTALRCAPRLLGSDGTTALSVALTVRAPSATEAGGFGKKLVIVGWDARPDDGAICVVAAVGDFVRRTSDGRLLSVVGVERRDDAVLYTVEDPKPWLMPLPTPAGGEACAAAIKADSRRRYARRRAPGEILVA